jgi:hypothetical protein
VPHGITPMTWMLVCRRISFPSSRSSVPSFMTCSLVVTGLVRATNIYRRYHPGRATDNDVVAIETEPPAIQVIILVSAFPRNLASVIGSAGDLLLRPT